MGKTKESMREALEEFDELRYSDPSAAIVGILGFLEDLEPELVPVALGVLGSALRLRRDYGVAESVIRRGLEYAEESLDHATAGNLFQRLSMVFWAQLEYREALVENGRAIAKHFDADYEVGLARSYVDRGVIVGSLGHLEWSNKCFKAGLRLLPEGEPRNLATALQGLSHNLLELGDLPQALFYFEATEKVPLDPLNSAKVEWFRGTTLSELGRFEEAIERLSNAIEKLFILSPNNAAVATIDLACTFLKAGEFKKAHRVAGSITRCLGTLGNHKAAIVAATELANIGLAGKGLTLSFLAHKRRKISLACD